MDFTKPERIHSKDQPDHIVLGLMVINIKNKTNTTNMFKENIDLMMDSLLSWSSGTPLHIIVITDKTSAEGNTLH